ncbi:MAG: DUF421 domain-containing protein [Acutalibacter sp.]|jgi:uncharacterized membrane protein YcaP (DUF421 family)|uniref:DUF421 domain-containing protein n=1 Tax=unclassified Acutalibacter TaxID=2620728 RepID=UPI001372C13A|nr:MULTISPECIES: DUF421 domain-containing protein [unclassified Acutalibacter]MCI9224646.1 DUF421 domain-containing protein [Acutalibacter sp.]
MLISLLRTVIMYIAILIGVRLMGKRQISQLQTSELVVTLLISELAVMPIQQHDDPLWNGLIPMLVLVVCEIVVSLFMLKSGKFRQAVCGSPMVVIENGRVLQDQMRRLRMSTEDLFEELRLAGAFALEDVAYAIVETNGKLSVLKKASADSLTPKQAGVKAPSEALEVVVVSDGHISEHSLKLCGKDPHWLREQLKFQGAELSDVFIMTARTDGRQLIIKKQPKKG